MKTDGPITRTNNASVNWGTAPRHMEEKQGYVYMLMNKNNTVIYAGVTNNLKKRVYEHKQKFVEGFSKKYKVDKLVYYEISDTVTGAIEREKQIKSGSRKKKMELIMSVNPDFKDLYYEI